MAELNTPSILQEHLCRHLPTIAIPRTVPFLEVAILETLCPSPSTHTTQARVKGHVPSGLASLVSAVNDREPRCKVKPLIRERAKRRGDHREDTHYATSRSARRSSDRSPVIRTRRRSSSVNSAARTSRTNWLRTVGSLAIASNS